MVEENEVRVGLSYFERASIVSRAVKEGVFHDEAEALKSLFASASRAKRSKIKSFLPVVDTIGAWIRYPSALTERLGLALSARIQSDADWGRRLHDRLRKADPETAEAETALLQKALNKGLEAKKGPQVPAAPKARPTPPPVRITRSKGALRLSGAGVTEEMLDAVEALVRDWQG